MASTFWAVLYFRSLKTNKVLALLTQYLFRYGKVYIPHVGAFELVQQPPQFNVVDKIILPPSWQLQWQNQDKAPAHQLQFIAGSSDSYLRYTEEELESTGKNLAASIDKKSFTWNGVGVIKKIGRELLIEKQLFQSAGLASVAAHKVIRERPEHNMLVGDREMTTQQVTDTLAIKPKKYSYTLLIGGALLLLAIMAIIYFLYLGQWQLLAGGLKSKP
ncbi:MAG: hypothetical protein V4676_03625 [Bacteroidota bacterium]